MPERTPAIFQASHHSVSASYGIVCKINVAALFKYGIMPFPGGRLTYISPLIYV